MELPPYLFCLLYFFLPVFEDNELLFLVPDVLCRHSEVVLWNLLSVEMFFWWIVGEKVVSPSYSSAILGPPLWMLSFKLTFSLSSFTFIQGFFGSSSLSAARVVSSAYLRSLIFLPAVLIPACDSSSPAFSMIYSTYKLNKQGHNMQPWHTPCPIWN